MKQVHRVSTENNCHYTFVVSSVNHCCVLIRVMKEPIPVVTG